jgi:hypothetical protein
VGKTAVVLTRQAQPFTKDRAERKTLRKSGEPLPARLIVSRILGDDGSLLAGLYILLAMCETLEQYTHQELEGFAKEAIGWVASRRL